MFENLSDKLERSFKILKGEGKITEINVAETLKDIRRALLNADVNYKVAKTFTDTVKEKAGYERAHGREAGATHGENCSRRVGQAHGRRGGPAPFGGAPSCHPHVGLAGFGQDHVQWKAC